jgi:hypothetical protein
MKVFFECNNNFMIALLFQWNPDNCNIMNIYPRSDGFEWDSHEKVNFINLSNFKQIYARIRPKVERLCHNS